MLHPGLWIQLLGPDTLLCEVIRTKRHIFQKYFSPAAPIACSSVAKQSKVLQHHRPIACAFDFRPRKPSTSVQEVERYGTGCTVCVLYTNRMISPTTIAD